MRFFSSEFAHDYTSYTFAYGNYCEREPGDALAEIYARGYLPYSGSRDVRDTFYMARSARVALAEFTLSSENRRIARKFDGTFRRERIPLAEFPITETFLSFCLDYFAQQHGSVMPRERLLAILESGIISAVVAYYHEDKPVAYVLEVEHADLRHYWFSFYDLTYAQQSLGLWLMLDCLRDAKQHGFAHYYLGTVYNSKALYKTNFEPLEWWDGGAWQNDIQKLKTRARTDAERTETRRDEWKENAELF